MLSITVPEKEYYDEEHNLFFTEKAFSLQVEHSLVSVAKWESKWQKAFLAKEGKTAEELVDYIRCMTVTQNVPPSVYHRITNPIMETVHAYMNAPMTATWFSDKEKRSSGKEIVTAEVIYYWMITLNIPVEFQKWHLNRLLTLIKVIDIKNSPKKKMSRRDILTRNKQLNEERRSRLHTSG